MKIEVFVRPVGLEKLVAQPGASGRLAGTVIFIQFAFDCARAREDATEPTRFSPCDELRLADNLSKVQIRTGFADSSSIPHREIFPNPCISS